MNMLPSYLDHILMPVESDTERDRDGNLPAGPSISEIPLKEYSNSPKASNRDSGSGLAEHTNRILNSMMQYRIVHDIHDP
jgi:hypothetical protein